MNTQRNYRKIMASLLLAMIPLLAAMPQDEALTLFTSPNMHNLGARWMEAYSNLHPDMALELRDLPAGMLQELPGTSGSILLLESESLEGIRTGECRMLCIGRNVYVPVIVESHPLYGDLVRSGIPPDAFTSGQYSAGDLSLLVRTLAGRNEVEAFIRSGSHEIAFCRLADVMDAEGSELIAGLKLVPVDKNGNGSIDYTEDIYATPESLQRGIWIGKYPKSLYSKLYAITSDRSLEAPELAFLNWLMTGGQSELLSAGYSGIADSELYSLREKLADTPAVSATPVVQSPHPRSYWIFAGTILVLLAIAFLPILFFRKSRAEEGTGALPSTAMAGEDPGNLPGGFFFDRSHTWAYMEQDGAVRVGIDPFLQQITGPISRVVIAEVGAKIRKGDSFLTLVQNGKKLQVHSPVSGMVREWNPKVQEDPGAVSRDPLHEGWICTLEPLNWMKDLRAFFMADRYMEWMNAEIQRLKDFFSSGIRVSGKVEPVIVLQDGGEPEPGVLASLGPEVWEEFQLKFMNKAM
jgi:glycine cleavage system H lipoate-binding protein